MSKALAALTRTRDSIGRATALALGGAGVGAAARIIRLIMDRIEKARGMPTIHLRLCIGP